MWNSLLEPGSGKGSGNWKGKECLGLVPPDQRIAKPHWSALPPTRRGIRHSPCQSKIRCEDELSFRPTRYSREAVRSGPQQPFPLFGDHMKSGNRKTKMKRTKPTKANSLNSTPESLADKSTSLKLVFAEDTASGCESLRETKIRVGLRSCGLAIGYRSPHSRQLSNQLPNTKQLKADTVKQDKAGPSE